MMKNRFQPGDALLIVDAQNDFFPGGALAVPQGDAVLPVINDAIEQAVANDIPIFASRDWHPLNHCSFKQQAGPWPIHCVQDSEGAKIHPEVHLPSNVLIINKADSPDVDAYSAFEGKTQTGISLHNAMKKKNIRRVWMSGLAQDYCVCESALDARKYGYEVHLLLKGTRPITKARGEDALKRMIEAGVIIED